MVKIVSPYQFVLLRCHVCHRRIERHFACVQMARAIIRNPEIVNFGKIFLISLSKSRQKIALIETCSQQVLTL